MAFWRFSPLTSFHRGNTRAVSARVPTVNSVPAAEQWGSTSLRVSHSVCWECCLTAGKCLCVQVRGPQCHIYCHQWCSLMSIRIWETVYLLVLSLPHDVVVPTLWGISPGRVGGMPRNLGSVGDGLLLCRNRRTGISTPSLCWARSSSHGWLLLGIWDHRRSPGWMPGLNFPRGLQLLTGRRHRSLKLFLLLASGHRAALVHVPTLPFHLSQRLLHVGYLDPSICLTQATPTSSPPPTPAPNGHSLLLSTSEISPFKYLEFSVKFWMLFYLWKRVLVGYTLRGFIFSWLCGEGGGV